MQPVDIVEAQLRAYNARDLDAFVACYAEDVVIEEGAGQVLLSGRESMRAQYGPFFADNPALHAEIVNRMQIGPYVVDEERISGAGPDRMHAVAIYRVTGDRIEHVRFLRA